MEYSGPKRKDPKGHPKQRLVETEKGCHLRSQSRIRTGPAAAFLAYYTLYLNGKREAREPILPMPDKDCYKLSSPACQQ